MANNEQLKTYRVYVGHWQARVKARDAGEAVQFARRQLAHELPRLYDVICKLTVAQFQVEAAA
jgi:hypothetical protein